MKGPGWRSNSSTGNFTDADGVLHLDASGLKDLHAQLGAVLKDFH